MKKITTFLLGGMMAAFFCTAANAQISYTNALSGGTLIYSNAFNGSSLVNITNTPASYEAGILGGSTGTNWIDLLGAANTNAFNADGSVGTPQGDSIVLPFVPQSNLVYVVNATVTFSTVVGSYIGAGFCTQGSIIGGSNDRYSSYGYNWGLIVESSQNVQGFGATSTQTSSTNGVFSSPINTPHTLTIIMDSTSNSWVESCLMDGVTCAGTAFGGIYHYPATPTTIKGVGLTQNSGLTTYPFYHWNSFTVAASRLVFLHEPVSANINQGANFTNSVIMAGTPPFAYQWYTNSVAIGNATNSTLPISSGLPMNASTNYYCVVTNVYGAITSSPASLVVYTVPQFLSANPVTYTNPMTLFGGAGTKLGSSPSFSVNAAGLQPMAYFWLTNGVAVGGANTNTFALTNCQLTSPTNFTCIASNTLGTVTNVWTAQYIPTPTAPYPQLVLADNPAGYWRLDEPAYDLSGQLNDGEICNDFMSGNNGFYTNTALGLPGYYVVANGVPFTNDPTETAAAFGAPVAYPSEAFSIGTNIDFSASSNAEFTVSVWADGGISDPGLGINDTGSQPANGGLVAKGGFGQEEFALDDGGSGGTVRFMVRNAIGGAPAAPSTAISTLQLGGHDTWHHLVGVCDESNGVINLYVDGLLVAQGSITKGSGVLADASFPITIGADGTAQFNGALNDVAIFPYAMNATQVNALYQAAGGVNPLSFTAPVPPTNFVWREGTTLTITANALGTPPLGYYWTNLTVGGIVAGAGVKGATGTSVVAALSCTLTITNADQTWSGDQLELVVTNASGSTNLFVTLTGYPAPITIGYTNSILYSNQFNGGTWNLAGTATTLANTLVGGTNTTWIDALGVNDTTGQGGTTPGMMEGNGIDNSTLGDSWVLPFTPHSGYIYTINSTVNMAASTGSSWIGEGFAGTAPLNATSGRFADSPIYGYDFDIWVISSANVQFLEGPGATFYITNTGSFYNNTTPLTMTNQVVLDTTGPQWVQYAFLDGIPCGTNTFASIPPIGSVGLTQTAIGNPNSVQWVSFSLTAVAPGGVPPYLIAPLPPTSNITLTNQTVALNATAFGSAPMGYYWINNSTVLSSGVTNTPNPITPNNAAPISANISVPASSLSAGTLDLVVTNAYGTNITAITLVSSVNTNPTNIVFAITSNQLSLSWPADHTGWRLQSQTNSLSTGINTNWVNVNGSTTTNMVLVPINLTNGSVFYRLVYP